MKRIIVLAAAIMMVAAPLALAQPKGGRPGKPETKEEKKEEAEKPAPELKFTSGLFGIAQNDKDWYFDKELNNLLPK